MVKKTEEDFEAEHDMRTLIEAEKIKNDKKRLARAIKKGKEQRAALATVMTDSKET